MASNTAQITRPGNSLSIRARIILMFTVAGVIVGALAAVEWFFGAAPAPVAPKPSEFQSTKGEIYHGPAQSTAVHLPDPRTTPKQKIRLISTGNSGSTEDPTLGAPINLTNQGTGGKSILDAKAAQAQVAQNTQKDDEDGEDNDLSKSLKRSNLGPKSVGWVDKDYLYTISAGRHIPCNMTNETKSQLLGFITCDIQGDVYSDGGILLFPNGSHAFGEYKQAVQHGNNVLGVLWRELRTDDRPPIKAAINAPGANQLGAIGMPGVVDTHFWDVFWATATFTALEAIPAIGIAALQNSNHNNNSFPYYALTSPGQSMGSRMLQDRMNQPPTLHSNPGSPLMIVLGTDLVCKKCVHLEVMRAVYDK